MSIVSMARIVFIFSGGGGCCEDVRRRRRRGGGERDDLGLYTQEGERAAAAAFRARREEKRGVEWMVLGWANLAFKWATIRPIVTLVAPSICTAQGSICFANPSHRQSSARRGKRIKPCSHRAPRKNVFHF
jgi:hypothetical protein